MLTNYEKALMAYWSNYKPGMGPFGKEPEDFAEPVTYKEDIVAYRLDDLADDILDNLKDLI